MDEQRISPLIRVRTGTEQLPAIRLADEVGQREQPEIRPWRQVVVVAVQQDPVRHQRQLADRPLGGQPQRGDDADLIDLGRAGVPDRAVQRPPADPRHQLLPGLWGEQLRIGHPERRRLGVRGQQHHTDRHRAGQRATADLVHRGQQARAGAPHLPLVAQRGHLAARRRLGPDRSRPATRRRPAAAGRRLAARRCCHQLTASARRITSTIASGIRATCATSSSSSGHHRLPSAIAVSYSVGATGRIGSSASVSSRARK